MSGDVQEKEIFRKASNSKVSQMEFIVQLLGSLTSNSPPTPLRLTKSHLIIPGDKVRCQHCKDMNIESKTAYKCSKCDIPLHANCFAEFHT